jgi:hypothetical protein
MTRLPQQTIAGDEAISLSPNQSLHQCVRNAPTELVIQKAVSVTA